MDLRILVSIIGLIAAAVMIVILHLVGRESRIGIKQFCDELEKKFDLNLISGRSDVEILKNCIDRRFQTYPLATLLEEYMSYLHDLTNSQDKHETISERYEKVKVILEEENKEKPFSGVPLEERRLLMALQDAMEHKDEQGMAFNLQELSSVITVRNRTYERSARTNRWSVPLAVIGLAAAIFLGSWGILRSVDYERISKITKSAVSEVQKKTAEPSK